MKLTTIRRRFKESLNRDQYDLAYTLQLWMAGDFDAIEAAINGNTLSGAWNFASDELANYPEIAPQLGPMGLQNHGFVNASINIQGIEMAPDFLFEHPDPIIREYNSAWVRERWTSQRWEDQFYQTGIEVEANGMSCCMGGISNGAVSWIHTPYLDTVVDSAHRSPRQYEWVCRRIRLTPEETERIYGSALTSKELDRLTEEEENCIGTGAASNYFGSARKAPMRHVVEWSWYGRDHHVVFLGSINGPDSVPLIVNDRNEYVKATETAGPNPFGIIPFAFWTGAWAPSMLRPTPKSMTTIRLAAMLNSVERFMVETMNNGVPLTTINVNSIVDRNLADDILAAQGWKGLSKIIPVQGSINNILERTEPAQLPAVCLHLRAVLKEEINAATGVQDMMRGQALEGGRTKFEVQTYNDMAGIQGRFLRRSYANFVEDVVTLSRAIGARHETAATKLILPDYGSFSTADYPVKAMLGEHLPVKVSPERLMFKTERERQQEAVAIINDFVLRMQQAGAPIDPTKVLSRFGKIFGLRDPATELCFSPEEMQQRVQSGCDKVA